MKDHYDNTINVCWTIHLSYKILKAERDIKSCLVMAHNNWLIESLFIRFEPRKVSVVTFPVLNDNISASYLLTVTRCLDSKMKIFFSLALQSNSFQIRSTSQIKYGFQIGNYNNSTVSIDVISWYLHDSICYLEIFLNYNKF